MTHRPDPDAPGLVIDDVGPVLRIRFERPERRNSLTRSMMERLVDLVENAVDRPELRAILIEGSGRDFCSGADLADVNQADPKDARTGDIQRRLPRQAHRLIPALLEVQLPVVSLVRGAASGIGAHIAFASDFVVASTTSRFIEPFVDRGFTPDSGGSFLLPRLVGLARARSVLLLGQQIDAETAGRWELVHAVVPDDEVEARGETLLEDLCSRATIAVGLTKSLIARAFDVSTKDALENEAFALELSARSRDFKEGMKAFAERRRPVYEGR